MLQVVRPWVQFTPTKYFHLQVWLQFPVTSGVATEFFPQLEMGLQLSLFLLGN
jgi:hypothetical protein